MRLTSEQLDRFDRDGILLLEDVLDAEDLEIVREGVRQVVAQPGPNVTPEFNSDTVRMVHGSHRYNDIMQALCRHPGIVEPAEQLLGSPVYVHQSRLNLNAGFGTGGFDWHQDYSTWHALDGLKNPRALMIAVFVDDMTAANGPLLCIPRSHRAGLIEEYRDQPDDVGNVLMKVTPDVLRDLAAEGGITVGLGSAGSVLVMHCEILHGSSQNISPYPRTLFYVNVSSVENPQTTFARAWYHANDDFTPLEAGGDDVLKRLPLVR